MCVRACLFLRLLVPLIPAGASCADFRSELQSARELLVQASVTKAENQEAVCDALQLPLAARSRAGSSAELELCPLCGCDKGSLRHYQLSCPHPTLVLIRDAQCSAVHEILVELYDTAHGPIEAHPSARLDRSADCAEWPLLRRGALLTTDV